MIRKLMLILFLVSASACVSISTSIGNKSYAFTGTTTTGVYVADAIVENLGIRDVTSFNQFSLSNKWGTITGHAGEYVSNNSGSSSATDGWVSGRGYRGSITWQPELLTLSTGTANVRICGRLGDTGTGSVLYAIPGTTTPFSLTITISEHVDWYRIEYNISAIGTDSFRSIFQITDSVR